MIKGGNIISAVLIKVLCSIYFSQEKNILGEKIERAPLSRIKIDKSKPVNTVSSR